MKLQQRSWLLLCCSIFTIYIIFAVYLPFPCSNPPIFSGIGWSRENTERGTAKATAGASFLAWYTRRIRIQAREIRSISYKCLQFHSYKTSRSASHSACRLTRGQQCLWALKVKGGTAQSGTSGREWAGGGGGWWAVRAGPPPLTAFPTFISRQRCTLK